MSRWAVILAGGSGTRFWPLSTRSVPKQFLPLVGDTPLLEATNQRLTGLVDPDRILIVTGAHLAAATRDLLPNLPSGNILAEPQAASTAPALAWATHVAQERDEQATIISLHADWVVGDDKKFRETASMAMDAAEEHDVLVTVGIEPTRAEVGYGYIELGDEIAAGVAAVRRFIEKPERTLAEELRSKGALWNSGLFSWTATRFFAEALEHAPEIAPHFHLLDNGEVGAFFKSVTPVAVDHSHYERSSRVAVVRGSFSWDDVGNWAALRRIRTLDEQGNVTVGNVLGIDASDCVGWSDQGPIVMYGVDDLIVVRANGVTLVTTRERAATLKEMLDKLPLEIREPTP